MRPEDLKMWLGTMTNANFLGYLDKPKASLITKATMERTKMEIFLPLEAECMNC